MLKLLVSATAMLCFVQKCWNTKKIVFIINCKTTVRLTVCWMTLNSVSTIREQSCFCWKKIKLFLSRQISTVKKTINVLENNLCFFSLQYYTAVALHLHQPKCSIAFFCCMSGLNGLFRRKTNRQLFFT